MAKLTNSRDPRDHLAAFANPEAFGFWLQNKPRQWSTVLSTRAALRVLPVDGQDLDNFEPVLARFRALSLAYYSAKYPNLALGDVYV